MSSRVVHAAARDHTIADLEMLGRRHGRGEFRLDDLRDRLGTAQWIDDAEFEAYGLSAEQISQVRQWAQAWVSDLEQRLSTGMDDDFDA